MKSKLREQALALMTTGSAPTIVSEPAASSA
jgi:hypothetical protein